MNSIEEINAEIQDFQASSGEETGYALILRQLEHNPSLIRNERIKALSFELSRMCPCRKKPENASYQGLVKQLNLWNHHPEQAISQEIELLKQKQLQNENYSRVF